MTEVYVEGHWCTLPVEVHPMHATALNALGVKHPVLGEVWIVPRSFPMRVARS